MWVYAISPSAGMMACNFHGNRITGVFTLTRGSFPGRLVNIHLSKIRMGDIVGLDVKSGRCYSQLAAGLLRLWTRRVLFDVQLRSTDGQFVKVHSAVIAAVNPELEALLTQDKVSSENERIITIDCVSNSSVMTSIVNIAYTASCEAKLQHMKELGDAAKTLKLATLQDL